jgi:hypothetical protein
MMQILRREDVRRSIMHSIGLVNDEYRKRRARVAELEMTFEQLLFKNGEQAEANVAMIRMHRERMSKLNDAMLNLAKACKIVCLGQESLKI